MNPQDATPNKATYKITGVICIISTLLSTTFYGIVSDWFTTLDPRSINATTEITIAISLLFLISAASFLLTIIDFLMHIFINSPFHINRPGFGLKILNSFVFIFFVLLFPIFLLLMIFNPFTFVKNLINFGVKQIFVKISVEKALTKTIQFLLVCLFILPIWIGAYYVTGQAIYQTARYKLGLYEDPIPLAGTGSMYPTFPKGQGKTPQELAREVVATAGMQPYPSGLVLFGDRYYGYEIGAGDIVDFSNEKTTEISFKDTGIAAGFVKRVIGIPGDTIELRDGIVYRNNEPIKEPYIAAARSTFGGDFLPDCSTKTVPNGKLFVMGDNRKGSLDSRYELGFISYSDISHVIPFEKQKGTLDKNWRDTSLDLENSSKISLDKETYLNLINQKRSELGVAPLKYQKNLESSAAKRAEQIIKDKELSEGSELNGDSMEKALNEIGYVHFRKVELPRQGHYEAIELYENQLEFPISKDYLLNPEYQEIGIAEVEGMEEGCPTQMIVQHLVGYVAPNYKKEDIDSWKSSLQRIKDVQPGWEKLKTYDQFYNENKADVDRITQIISLRISHIETIIKRMEKNEWLTSEENGFIDQEKSLSEEQNTLADKLNSKSN